MSRDFSQADAAAPRRWSRAVAAAAMAVAASLIAPSAGSAVAGAPAGRGTVSARQAAPAAGPVRELARLKARAAALSRQYRGQVLQLTDAEKDADTAMARRLLLRRQLGRVHRELGRLAAASYMSGVQDPVVAMLGGADPQRALEESATIQYLASQRTAQERALEQYMLAAQHAERALRAKIATLRRLVAALAGQRRRVEALIARFQPQSLVVGDNITPRMRQVKDAIDQRFGPFPDIGCYRAEASGEHPLGRACDFMLSTGGVMPTAANVQRGYKIAAWAQANASRLGIMYIIYRQRMWDIRMASSGWVTMADRGGITANHDDHVHISVF